MLCFGRHLHGKTAKHQAKVIPANLVLDKMLLVTRCALKIPRDCAIPQELAACPLPLATGPNEAAISEQLQILQCCRGSFAVYFLSHLQAPKNASGTGIVCASGLLAGKNTA